MILRALVVDDEAPARSRMRRLLAERADVECVGEAAHGVEALERIDALAPDVVFLDVQMPEMDGIATARAVAEDGPAIIFVTAFDQFAIKAFEVSAVDYLVKPVDRSRLAEAIDRARKRRGPAGATSNALGALRNGSLEKMAVRSGATFAVFDVANITAILARDDYAAIIVGGVEHLVDDTLERLYKRLDEAVFVRVHRSGIVSVAHVVELVREGDRKYAAKLSDGTIVPISRAHLDEIKSRLGVLG